MTYGHSGSCAEIRLEWKSLERRRPVRRLLKSSWRDDGSLNYRVEHVKEVEGNQINVLKPQRVTVIKLITTTKIFQPGSEQ